MSVDIRLAIGENLAETLDVGDFTADGQKIRALNGTSSLNFRVSNDNEVLLTNDDVAFLAAYLALFPTSLQIGFNAINGLYLDFTQLAASFRTLGVNSFLAGNVGDFGLTDVSQDAPLNANTFKIIDNGGTDRQSTTANVAAFFNSGSNANVSKILADVFRSACVSGEGLTAKTSNTLYINQTSFQEINVLFDCILKSSTMTADRTLTLPDKDGMLVVDTYEEKWTTYNAVNAGVWEVLNIPDALESSLLEIICFNETGSSQLFGVRQVGSGLDRSLQIDTQSSLTITVKTDNSKDIEVYTSDTSIKFIFSAQL